MLYLCLPPAYILFSDGDGPISKKKESRGLVRFASDLRERHTKILQARGQDGLPPHNSSVRADAAVQASFEVQYKPLGNGPAVRQLRENLLPPPKLRALPPVSRVRK